jgi:hypothetical protein
MAIPKDWYFGCHGVNGTPVVNDVHGVCPHCRNASTFKIEAQLPRNVGPGRFQVHLLLQCNSRSCQKIVHVATSLKELKMDSTGEFFIYPSRTVDPPHPSVPMHIADDWIEAQKAMEAGAPKAAAVMCRRVLYGVILDKKCKESPIKEGAKQLITEQRLPAMFDEWLPAITDDGHDAAHPHRALNIDPANVGETMEYTSELLRNLYIEPYEFQQRKARNAAKP